MNERKPNVIILMSDEHRGQAMSHCGDSNVSTPGMDRIAGDGVSFTRAYSNCPLCTPSRGTIFSGRHAHAGPVSGFFDVYTAGAPSAATLFRDSGYRSAYFGKWHCGIVRDQIPESNRASNVGNMTVAATRTPTHYRGGFQDWFGNESVNSHFRSHVYKAEEVEPTPLRGYETDELTSLFTQYLEEYDREEPLFAVLSVTPPHFPLEVPEMWRRHDPKDLSLRDNFAEVLTRPNSHPVPDPWNSNNPMHEHTLDMRDQLSKYYGLIENWDHNIERVLQTIESLDRFKGRETLLVYISDHGELMGSHGLYDRKEHPYEEAVRVPMIFRQPEIIPSQGAVDMQIGLVDLLPTILDIVGIQVPSWIHGTSFSRAVLGKTFTPPTEQLIEMLNNPRWNLDFLDWRGFVDGKWKYAYYETGDEILFDLENDPYEVRNLAASRRDLCEEMRERLLSLLRANDEPFFHIVIEHGSKVPVDKRNVSGVDYRIITQHGDGGT